MKKTPLLLSFVLSCGLVLSACSTGGEAHLNDEIYRGVVTNVQSDGSYEITQVPGYDYGQPSILFHIEDDVVDSSAGSLAEGAFVQITYDGKLTRSLPAQGTALAALVISPHSEGIVQNGTIQNAETTDDGYTLHIQPIDVEAASAEDDLSSQVVLLVPKTALEGGLTAEDLKPGTQVSAVTRGIAAMSLPPQMPVLALLPYSAATQ